MTVDHLKLYWIVAKIVPAVSDVVSLLEQINRASGT